MKRDRSYRKIFEEYYGIKIIKGYHIHHIDGDRNNNDPQNLEMLTPDEHAQKHGYISNWMMAQDRASKVAIERAIEKLRTPELRLKMSESMKNSDAHKKFIMRRSENEQWRKNVSEAARKTAKSRTNETWNKNKRGLYKTSQKTKDLLSTQRAGRKWYNDGKKTFFIKPENALPEYKLGRIHK